MRRACALAVASAAWLALTTCAVPRAASAAPKVDKKACITSSESGQKLRHDGKLRDAREQLLVCARPECPVVIRQDCTQFVNEVLASTPSVVIAARDSSGKETLNVKVSVDGDVALTKLDGKALVVDPGVHVFQYEAEDGLVVQEDVGIREGEKNRVLYVSFHKSEPEAGPPVATPAPAPPGRAPATATATRPRSGGVPVGAYVFGGIGLVGVGLGTLFLVTANSDASDLRNTCAPACAHSDVSAARNKALLGDVAIAVGGVALVAAVWMVISSPRVEKPTTAALRLGLTPTPRGAAMGLRGSF